MFRTSMSTGLRGKFNRQLQVRCRVTPKRFVHDFLSLVSGAVRSRSYPQELTNESAAVSPSIYGVARYYREG
jgi:hypothetical protein